MTLKEVFEKAYLELVNEWAHESEIADALPNNQFAQGREQTAWDKINELMELAKEMGVEF